jgi:hypothetical protein
MADRDGYEGYGSDRDRWRDRAREPGWRADDERRSWRSEDYGRGFHREGGSYGQGAWRGAGQRSLQHDDQRYGSHRDTGETWGERRNHRDQKGREDFGQYGGQYGQTGAGGDHGHGRERHGPGGPETNRQFGRGGYGEGGGGSRAPGDHAGYSGGAFGPGGYGAYPDANPVAGHSGGAVGSRLQGGYGPGGDHGHGREGHGQHGHGMTLASTHGDFEPDYLHWRNTQMQNLDRDYLRWREERRSKFAKDFDEWRKSQAGRQGQSSPTGQSHTAGQGSSGGLSSDQDRSGGLTNRMVSGDTGQLGREDKKKT